MTQPTAVILAAVVGAISALVTALLKDYIFVRRHQRLDKKSGQRDVLRLYVAPLAQASEKLIWRLSEIFLAERHQFLKSATLPLVFNEYKRQSTLYRIASLLGWMRAIQLELNALEVEGIGLTKQVRDALEGVRKALADGPDVERLRLKKLVDVWQLGEPDSAGGTKLAAELERRLYAVAGDKLKHDARHLQHASRAEKLAICRSLADFLAEVLKKAKLSDAFLEERVEAAILGMSYREALIYRDWQDAIGDIMLIRDQDSARRFTLINYASFVEKLNDRTLWMEVFSNSIVDIDFDAVDVTDYRATQLSALSASVSQIMVAIAAAGHKDLVDPATLQEAHKLAAAVR